jgi:7-cyano-7-deazaguanine synthase
MIAVLCSGGLDSTVLAHMAQDRGALAGLVFCDYGQPATTQEARASGDLALRLGVPWVLLRVPMADVSGMAIGTGEPGPRVIGGRNLILLAHAVGVCQARGWSELWWGATKDDWQDYPDCRLPFMGSIQQAAGAYGVRVLAPLIEDRAAEIRAHGDRLGVDWSGVWSCYEPDGDRQCGRCNSCARLHGQRRPPM